MSSASSVMASSTTSAAPSPTSTAFSSDSSPTSRPLLFFVALGFGVVFTNLWIIVGVKYCFRYNRGRQNQQRDQNGDPIDMNNMHRPRRRREKKLMSMDEVNERFPLTKYKIWRSGREQHGLSSAGGITAPPSRAASIREHNDLKRVSTEIVRPIDGGESTRGSVERPHTRCDSGLDGAHEGKTSKEAPRRSTSQKTPQVQETQHPNDDRRNSQDHQNAETPDGADEDEDPIQQAGVPAEYANAPGDTCAICIDTLEDEDDVRGLTCGHAFHAGCLDPWLTSRRACCPLCKADFYVPKPKSSDGATVGGAEGGLPREPEQTHRPRVNVGGSNYLVDFHYRYGFPTLIRERPAPAQNEQPQPGRIARLRSNLPTPRMPFRRQQTVDANRDQPTTPGQLEAGTQ